MKLLNLTDKVYSTYTQTVRGRADTTLEEARKIMTRNMKLAKKANSEGYRGQMYKYGCLWFVVIDNNVVWIRNHCYFPAGWKKNEKLYNRLNKKMGIDGAGEEKEAPTVAERLTAFLTKVFSRIKGSSA